MTTMSSSFNLYRQDFPVTGLTSQIALVHNRNRENEKNFVDDNGFLTRPAALGMQKHARVRRHLSRLQRRRSRRPLEPEHVSATTRSVKRRRRTFVAQKSDISAAFAALEVSRDFDWLRVRARSLWQRRRRSVRRQVDRFRCRSSRIR